MAIKISGSTIIDDSRVVVNADKIGIGTPSPSRDLEILSSTATGIGVSATSTQTTDTNKAISVFNNTSTNNFSVSYKGRVDAVEYYGTFKGSIDPGVAIENASKIQIHHNSTNSLHNIPFFASDLANDSYQDIQYDNSDSLKYNPSTGRLQVNSSDGFDALTIRTNDNAINRGLAFQNSGNAYVGYIGMVNAGSNSAHMVFGVDDGTEQNVDNVIERLRITKTGHVMIGTITEGNANADEFTISFNNTGVPNADKGRCGMTIRSGSNTSNVEQNGYIYFSNGTSGDNEYKGTIVYEHDNDALKFGTNGGVERLRITSTGQVGIGTDTMDSSGNLNITDTGSARIYMKSGNSSDCSIYFGAFDDVATAAIRYDHDVDTLRFYGYNNSHKLYIDDNSVIVAGGRLHASRTQAKFGIDCHTLDIFDDVNDPSNYGMVFYNDPTTDKANGIGFFNDDGQSCGGYIVHQDKGGSNIGDIIFATSSSANTPVEKLRITSTGEVGIGEDSPNATLDVRGTALIADDIGSSQPSTFPASNVQLMVYTSTNGQPITNTNCARLLIATDAKQVGAQGYNGAIDFGNSDATASGNTAQFNYRVASIMSNAAGDTGTSTADGDLQFWTKESAGSLTEKLRITSAGSVNIGGGYSQTTRKLYVDGDAEVTGTLHANIEGSITPSGDVTITGNLQVDGNTILGDATSDTLTINATPTIINDNGLYIRSKTSNATDGAQIRFSDISDESQKGFIKYKHSDGNVAPGSNDGFIIGGTETLTVVKVEGRALVDDKVGIGTTNPTNKLDVIGDAFVSSKVGINSTSPREKLDVTAGRIILDQGYQLTWANGTTNRARIYGDSGSNFIVETGSSNTEKLRVTSGGDVKIVARGSTTSGAPLYVAVTGKSSITYAGGNDDTACVRIEDEGGTNSYYHGLELRSKRGGDVRLYCQDKGSDASDFVLATDNSGLAERFRIKSSGEVNIGTSGGDSNYLANTQNAGLDVWGDGSSYPTLRLGTEVYDTEGEDIRFGRTDHGGTDIRYHSITSNHHATDSSNYLKFKVHDGGSSPFQSQATVLTLLGSGNVGINETSPSYLLDVSGVTDPSIRLKSTGTANSDDTVMRYLIGGTTASNYIYFGDSGDTNIGMIRYSHNTDSLRITVNASERLVINSDGDLLRGGNSQDIGASDGRWDTGYFNTIDATSITGTVSGSTDKIQTASRSTNADHYLTFVDSNNASAAAESLYTDAGIKYNPSTNDLTIDGDMTVGGVLTYEDVTNVDSIGIITARAGADIKGAKLDVQSGSIHLSKDGGDNTIEMGKGQTGNHYAYIDMVGDATYTDYGFRLLRGNSGANAQSQITHRGTGDFLISAGEAAKIKIRTNTSTSPKGLTIAGNGKVGVNVDSPQQALQVDGFIYLGPNNTGSFVHGGANVTYSSDSNIYFVADANDTSGVAPAGEFIWGGGSNTNTDSNRDFTAAEFGNDGKPRNEYLILDENSLRPAADDGLDLGTSSLKFNEIFATTVTADSITGTLQAPGSDTQVLFNDGGTNVGADAGLTFNKTSDKLTVSGDIKVGGTLFFDETSGGVEKIDVDGGNLDLHSDGSIRFFESDGDTLMIEFDVNTTNGDSRIIMENDTDTYFNHPAGNQLGFTAGNQEVIRIQSTALNLKKDIRYGASDSSLRTSHIYVCGTGYNNTANRQCTINGVDQISGSNNTNRGLHLLIFDTTNSLTLDSGTTYDTHGSSTASDNLATAMGDMNREKIGVLVSFDAIASQITNNLRAQAQRNGLFKLAGMSGGETRQPYAAIFRGTSDDTNAEVNDAIEVVQSDDADAPTATISTFITVKGNGENATITGAYSVSALVAPVGGYESPLLQGKSSTNSASTLTIGAGVHLLPSGSASNDSDANGVDLGGGSNYLRQIYVRKLNADSVVGTISGSASQVTLANDTSDVDGYITFSNGATGNQNIKTNANLRYDAADGILEVRKTDGGIKFGPGTASSDDAHIEWKGGSDAGYLRISTSDNSDSTSTNEYIEIGDYASQNKGGAFTQHVRIARDEFLVRTGSNTISQADRLKINENGRSLFTGDVTEILRLSQDVDASTQQEFGIGFAANATHTNPAAQITYKELDASDSRGSLLFYTRNSNSDAAPDERLRINSSGYVGVGEDTPATILHVKANVGDMLRLDRNNTGAVGNQIAFRHSASGTLTETGSVNCVSTANAATGELRFSTKASGASNAEKLRITSAGSVNIGGDYTQTTKKFKVTGNAEIDGDLDVSGTLTYEDVTNVVSVGIVTASAFRALGATFKNTTGSETDPSNVAMMIENNDYIYTHDSTASKRRLIGKSAASGTEVIEIGQSGTALIDEIRMSPGNAGKFTFYKDTTKKLEITNDGMVRIGESSPIVVDATGEEAVYLKADIRNADADTVYGIRMDIDDDNTGTTTGDRERGSILLDFDGANAGGNTSNELRVYNIWNDIDINNDYDVVRGVYNDININYTTGQSTQVVGTYNLPRSTSAATISNMYGSYNDVYKYGANSTSSISGMYGGLYMVRNIHGATGSVTNMYGVRSECRISDGNTGNNANTNVSVTNAYAVYARMENDNYVNTNMGTSGMTALFYGAYGGSGGTNGLNTPYGIYITASAPDNYLGGDLEVNGNLKVNGNITGDTGVADVEVSYTNRANSCSNPITISGTTTKTINIPNTSNADGHKYVQNTEPTGASVCNGDVWYDTSGSAGSGSGFTVQNNGSQLSTTVSTLNFSTGVTASGSGGTITITASSGVSMSESDESSFRQIVFTNSSSSSSLKCNDDDRLMVRPSDGAVRVKGDITAFYSSDARLKKNISPIYNALEKVTSISGNTFEWNDQSLNEGKEVGVLAHEIEKLGLPNIVTTRDNGFKAVRYEKLVPLLIEAIKELKEEVDELKSNK